MNMPVTRNLGGDIFDAPTSVGLGTTGGYEITLSELRRIRCYFTTHPTSLSTLVMTPILTYQQSPEPPKQQLRPGSLACIAPVVMASRGRVLPVLLCEVIARLSSASSGAA